MPWCLYPADVNIRLGDLKVMVYGFSVISAVRPPVEREYDESDLERDTAGTGSASGNNGILG